MAPKRRPGRAGADPQGRKSRPRGALLYLNSAEDAPPVPRYRYTAAPEGPDAPRNLDRRRNITQQPRRSQYTGLGLSFELGQPDAGRALYLKGHIPGALYAHLDEDLAAPRTPWSGRHPLPDPAVLSDTFSRWGIDDAVQVVAYDDAGGAYAARLWWLLRWMGHRRVAVLDGGYTAWKAAGLPSLVAASSVAPRTFAGTADYSAVVTGDDVAEAVAAQRCVLLDARSAERFEGRVEPLDPRAGHIPGAQSFHFARNLGVDGRFLPCAAPG